MDTLLSIISLLFGALIYLGIFALIFAVVKAIRNNKFTFTWPPLSLILGAIILGAIVTGLYTGNEAFVHDRNCGSTMNQTAQGYMPSHLDETCANLAYGFPRKFISGQTYLSVTKQPPINLALNDIEASSKISLSTKSLAFDMTVWSVCSFAALSVIYLWSIAEPKRKK